MSDLEKGASASALAELSLNTTSADSKSESSGGGTTNSINTSTPARRSLRPGGMVGGIKKLNEGPAQGIKAQKKIYQKDILLKFKPENCSERNRPQLVESYGTIMIVEANTQKVNLTFQQMFNRPPGYGYRQKEKLNQQTQGNGVKASPNASLKKGDKGSNSGENLAGIDPQNWNRGAPQASSHVQPSHGKNKKVNKQDGENVTPSRTTQQPTSVVEKMAHEVLGILNKITPNTSVKLTQKLCEIPILNNAMLDKMIQLIFEKAIRDINFANLYAEMCYTLEQGTKNLHWEAIKVVHDLNDNVYFSIKDLEMTAGVTYGPFSSKDECISGYVSSDPCESLANQSLQKIEYILVNDSILKIGTSGKQEYFVSLIAYSDINEDAISSKKNFISFEAAQDDLQKKNTFRRRLLVACQQEYQDAVTNRGKYGEFIEMKQKAMNDIKNLTGDEREQQIALIEEKERLIRQRKFGMLRFIGELVTKNMLKSSQMLDCIDNLLAESDEEGISKLDGKGKIIWKANVDEEDLEALCKLLITVGNTLETNSTTNEKLKIDEYFKRLQELTKSKTLNSRIKFQIEEVITLRRNNWQARREQEGPSKISEIHKKILKEQSDLEQHLEKLEKEEIKGKSNLKSPNTFNKAPLQQRQFNDEKKIEKGGFGGFSNGGSTKSIGFAIGVGTPSSGAVSFNIGSGSKVKSTEKLTDDKVEQKLNAIFDEYLTVNEMSINEIVKEFKDLPVDIAVEKLVIKSLGKYAECNNSEIRTKLLKLLDSVRDTLANSKNIIQDALSKFEPILNLCDYEQDVKDAPILLGTVVRSLIKLNACEKQFILTLVSNAQKQIALDEYAPTANTIQRTYDSFLSSIDS